MANPDPLGGQTGDNTSDILKDVASSTVTYTGFAPSGTSTNVAGWLIMKEETSGTLTSISWADGGQSHNQIWDNRASLTYRSLS